MLKKNTVAVVLFSGGLDSTTVATFAKNKGFDVYAISFDYGQRNKDELQCAVKVADCLGLKHVVLSLDINVFSHSDSSLVNLGHDVEIGSSVLSNKVPNTYVPARNMLFISHGISYLESIGGLDLFIGVNTLDYGNYPDCRREFIDAMENAATLGSKICHNNGSKYTIHTPIINMNKAEIIKLGTELGIDYSLTLSCYNPKNKLACGICLSCTLRKKGFAQAGLKDVTRYF
ncbi:MAG: 7-cyano-7-deazaguanine synthase QueC [Alphaproteobacteria bacterium]|nr:7-cyano-7-deazaguanine synthase QueC [Rickettsiales bacterium]